MKLYRALWAKIERFSLGDPKVCSDFQAVRYFWNADKMSAGPAVDRALHYSAPRRRVARSARPTRNNPYWEFRWYPDVPRSRTALGPSARTPGNMSEHPCRYQQKTINPVPVRQWPSGRQKRTAANTKDRLLPPRRRGITGPPSSCCDHHNLKLLLRKLRD